MMDRRLLGLLGVCLVINAVADGYDMASARGDDTVTSADSQRLSGILERWAKESSRRQCIACRFRRLRYDGVFEIEFRGDGELLVHKDGRALYRVEPAFIAAGSTTLKRTPAGKPYRLQSDDADRWHWTGEAVIRVNETNRTYDSLPLSKQTAPGRDRPSAPAMPDETLVKEPLSLWDNWSLSWDVLLAGFPLARPFLLGSPVAELQSRYVVELIKQADGQIWLSFVPKWPCDRFCSEEAKLILDETSFLPVALWLRQPGDSELVYRFLDVNAHATATTVDKLDNPDLRGFRRLSLP